MSDQLSPKLQAELDELNRLAAIRQLEREAEEKLRAEQLALLALEVKNKEPESTEMSLEMKVLAERFYKRKNP